MRLTPGTIAAGTALYAAVAGSTYLYINSSRALPQDASASSSGCSCLTRFDRLAGCYDDKVGSEERVMLYGLMRWWLLRGLKGDVLEISAGTGRNLQHYPLSALSSLTLTDTSVDMLQVAETKYYDQLKLGYKHPEAVVKFLVSDAQHMVAREGEAPVEAPLHRAVAATATAQHRTGAKQAKPASHSSSTIPSSTRSSTNRTASDSDASSSNSSTTSSSNGHEAGATEQSAGAQAQTLLTSIFSQLWRHNSKLPADAPQAPPAISSTQQQTRQVEASDSRSSESSASDSIKREPALSGLKSGSGGNATSSDDGQNSSRNGVGGSAGGDLRLSKFQPHSFDVVVDTFGLCSHEDPVLALREASRLCRPGGRIVLLEHGRSSWSWLNERMDAAAQKHFDKWGCWYNRDIISIVKEAGLELDSSSRWHFGTSYMIVAQPPAQS